MCLLEKGMTYQFWCYGCRMVKKKQHFWKNLGNGSNTHTSFLPNANPTFNNFQHQDEIPHLNQQPNKWGKPPQSLTWKLENDGFQVRWKSPFPRWIIFQVNHVHPTEAFAGERNRNSHHYPLFRQEFHDHLKFKPPGFIRVHSPTNFANMYPSNPTHHFFSSILKFPSLPRCMKRSLLYEVSEGRRGETAVGVAWRGVFRPRRFFLGKMDLKKMGKDWKIFGFETGKSSFSDFKIYFWTRDCLLETGNMCVCLLAILKFPSTGFAIKVFQIQ